MLYKYVYKLFCTKLYWKKLYTIKYHINNVLFLQYMHYVE